MSFYVAKTAKDRGREEERKRGRKKEKKKKKNEKRERKRDRFYLLFATGTLTEPIDNS